MSNVEEEMNDTAYPFIRIDMDYCADPLWGAQSADSGFVNLSLEEFKPLLSKDLMHLLSYYQHSWEYFNSSKYMSISEEFEDKKLLKSLTMNLLKLQVEAAKKFKQEMVNTRVYFCFYDNDNHLIYKEIVLDNNEAVIIDA